MGLDFPGDGHGGAGRDGGGSVGLEEELNFPEMNWVCRRGSLWRGNRILRKGQYLALNGAMDTRVSYIEIHYLVWINEIQL